MQLCEGINTKEITTNIFNKRYSVFNDIIDGKTYINNFFCIQAAILLNCITQDGYIIVDPSIVYSIINTNKKETIYKIKNELFHVYKKKCENLFTHL